MKGDQRSHCAQARVTGVCLGRPWSAMNLAAMCIDSFFSDLEAFLPVHTKIESPVSKMYLSFIRKKQNRIKSQRKWKKQKL